MPSDGSGDRGDGPLWRAESRLRSEIRARVEKEAKDAAEPPASKVAVWEPYVMTAFESRGALWPSEFRTWRRERDAESPFQTPDEYDAAPRAVSRRTGTTDDMPEIDEGFLRSQRVDDLMSTVDAIAYEEQEKDSEPEEVPFEGDDPTRCALHLCCYVICNSLCCRPHNETPRKLTKADASGYPSPASARSNRSLFRATRPVLALTNNP